MAGFLFGDAVSSALSEIEPVNKTRTATRQRRGINIIITPRVIKSIIFSLLVFTLFCKGQTASAQIFLGAGPEALGDSGRAANEAIDGHFLNPASLAYSKGTNVGGAYQVGDTGTDSPQANYALVITDNDPQAIVVGGFGYVYKRMSSPAGIIYDQDFSLDFAGHITPNIAWGVQGHRLFRQNSAAPGFTKYNATFGVLALPVPILGLAFVAYDALGDSDLQLIPILSLGLNLIIMDIVHFRADVTRQEMNNPNHQGTLNLGTEFDLGYSCLLRVGGLWNQQTNQNYFTAGFGFEGPKLNLGYAYKTNLQVAGDSFQTLDAWLTF